MSDLDGTFGKYLLYDKGSPENVFFFFTLFDHSTQCNERILNRIAESIKETGRMKEHASK